MQSCSLQTVLLSHFQEVAACVQQGGCSLLALLQEVVVGLLTTGVCLQESN